MYNRNMDKTILSFMRTVMGLSTKEQMKVMEEDNTFDMSDFTCALDEEQLENILAKMYNSSEKEYDSILVQRPEKGIKIEEKEIESYNPKLNESLLKLLLKSDNTVDSFPDIPKSSNTTINLSEPKIKTKLEKVYLKININKTKMAFLQLQLYMLETYYTKMYEKLDEEAKGLFLLSINCTGTYHIIEDESLNGKSLVDEFIRTFPGVIGDIKKYIDIIKSHDRESSM